MRKTDINNFNENQPESSPVIRHGTEIAKASGKLLLRILTSAVGILFIAGVVIGISMIIYLVGLSKEPTGIDLKARKLNLTSFVYVYDDNGEPVEYQQLYSQENRVWVDYNDIPVYMKKAIIAIEDKRFKEHSGVDWLRTGSAVFSLLTGNDSYGGSTLTQQLIKNITKDNEVSINRKLREVFRALKLEKEYTKDEILEAYLNIVNFGSNTGGVQSAANMYFNKDIQDCSIAECAAIAGITQNPSRYNPLYFPEYNKERRETVIGVMYEQGAITKAEYTQAMKDSAAMVFETDESNDEEEYDKDEESINKNNVQNWYFDALVRQLQDDLAENLGISSDAAEEKLYTEGLKIYCAMDTKMQEYAENYLLELETPYDEDLEVGYVLMSLDGRVIATVGSRNEKTGNLLYDRANMAVLQPGSTIKPLGAYPLAIENGNFNFSSTVMDEPIKKWGYENGDWVSGPNNWYSGYNGAMLLPDALEWSSNATAAQTLDMVGVQNSYSFVTGKLGFSHLSEEDSQNLAGLSIGGLNGGVTVSEMAAGYLIYGSGGKYYKPYTYYYVTDQNDNVILDNRVPYPMQALSKETAWIMNRLLNYNVNNSVHTGAGVTRIPGWDIIGKTGTTDYDKDSWYCGLCPIAVSAMWTGYDDPQRINKTNVAVNCWHDLMEHYLEDKEVAQFKTADNVIEADFCRDTGLLASEGCTNVKKGYYTPDNMPEYCDSFSTSDTDTDTEAAPITPVEENTDSDEEQVSTVSEDTSSVSSTESTASDTTSSESGDWWTSTPIYTSSTGSHQP